MANDFQADPRYVYGPAAMMGQSLGAGLGQGLAGLFDDYQQKKLQTAQRTKTAEFFYRNGFDRETAEALAWQPESIQREALKQQQRKQEGMGFEQMLNQILNPAQRDAFPSSAHPESTAIGTSTHVPVSREGAKDLINIAQKERKLGMEEKKGIRQSWKDFDKILEKKREAAIKGQDRLETIDRMLELNKSGELPNPALVKFLNSVGFGDAFWLGPDSEEYQSLQKDFFHDMKEIFGSKVSDMEVRTFMSYIPTLMNSEEGRERLLQKFKRIQQARKAEYEAMRNVKSKYKGKEAPDDFFELVDKKKQKKIDRLHKDIFGDISQKASTAPDLSTIEPNTVYQNPDTGKFGRLENGQWKEYDYNPEQNPYGALYGMGKS